MASPGEGGPVASTSQLDPPPEPQARDPMDFLEEALDSSALSPDRLSVEAMFYGNPDAAIAAYRAGILVQAALMDCAVDPIGDYYHAGAIVDPAIAAATCRSLAKTNFAARFGIDPTPLEVGTSLQLEDLQGFPIRVPLIREHSDHVGQRLESIKSQIQPEPQVVEDRDDRELIKMLREDLGLNLPGKNLDLPRGPPALPPEQLQCFVEYLSTQEAKSVSFETQRLAVLRGIMYHAITLEEARFQRDEQRRFTERHVPALVTTDSLKFLQTKYCNHTVATAVFTVAAFSPAAKSSPTDAYEISLETFMRSIVDTVKLDIRCTQVVFPIAVRTQDNPALLPAIMECDWRNQRAPCITIHALFAYKSSAMSSHPFPDTEDIGKELWNAVDAARLALITHYKLTAKVELHVHHITADQKHQPAYAVTLFLALMALRARVPVLHPSQQYNLLDIASWPAMATWLFGSPAGVSDPNEVLQEELVAVSPNASLVRYSDAKVWPVFPSVIDRKWNLATVSKTMFEGANKEETFSSGV